MSRLTQGRGASCPIRGCHPLRPAFPDGSGSQRIATGLVRFRSPLLAESRLMSFPPATEMFQFAGFASRTYGFSPGSPGQARGGCPIRRSRDQRSLASPPGFSQRATSFIASWRQGIHQMPLPQRLIAKPVARRDKPRRHTPRSQVPGTRRMTPPQSNASRMKTLLGKRSADTVGSKLPLLPLHTVKDRLAGTAAGKTCFSRSIPRRQSRSRRAKRRGRARHP